MERKRLKRLVKTAADIKADLALMGLTLAAIDREHGLPEGTARDALRGPNERGEAAIASALGVRPSQLWPDRYDGDGRRHTPQPRENYDRPPPIPQRRKQTARMAGAS